MKNLELSSTSNKWAEGLLDGLIDG
jgi:hypothetical protein